MLPPAVVSSAGSEAVDLAASAGLILDDWQRWSLEHSLSERSDGMWAAFEVGLIAPRQNGKDVILEARELAGLVLFDEPLIVHSAHRFDTAQEHFLRMQQLVESCEDLRRKVARIPTANGKEAIVLRSGARLKFVARSRGAARGFTGDCLVLNEAFLLSQDAMGAMLPALSARPNPQVWYASSAPHYDSHVLHALRRRAGRADPGRLFYAEWGNEAGVDPYDRDAWYRANPALGTRISEEFVENELAAMEGLGDEFLRERLGVASQEDSGATVFGEGKWGACADEKSRIDGPRMFALDVSPDMGWASICVAGRRSDGVAHVELVDRRPGTEWSVARAAELLAKWGGPLAVDPKSPTASLFDDLDRAGVDLLRMPDGQMSAACATLQQQVTEGKVRHLGQRPLDDAVASAARRTVGDSWVWARVRSDVDITPLVGVTVALWGVDHAPARKPVFAY